MWGGSMRFDILTLFPEMFRGPFDHSIVKRAIDDNRIVIGIHDIRVHTHDKHHTTDDYAYGGGAGMVMKPEPVFEAVEAVRNSLADAMPGIKPRVVLLTPQGRLFNQAVARELAVYPWLVFICGHYEGIDERVCEHLADDAISIGDYVLSGGEIAAMVVVDAVARLVPGVLGSGLSLLEESHADGLLEYPQYTRPPVFRDWPVPEVLLSGNHGEIARWRREQSLKRTLEKRPDLLEKAGLSEKEKEMVEQFQQYQPRSE
jgi:tRNA (guanine37-N1)-methyltransferase